MVSYWAAHLQWESFSDGISVGCIFNVGIEEQDHFVSNKPEELEFVCCSQKINAWRREGVVSAYTVQYAMRGLVYSVQYSKLDTTAYSLNFMRTLLSDWRDSLVAFSAAEIAIAEFGAQQLRTGIWTFIS